MHGLTGACQRAVVFGLLVSFTGDMFLQPLGRLGAWLKKVKGEHPWAFYGCIFLLNSFSSSLGSTGAFEILSVPSGELLFSKLKTGMVPTREMIMDIVSQQLQLA